MSRKRISIAGLTIPIHDGVNTISIPILIGVWTAIGLYLVAGVCFPGMWDANSVLPLFGLAIPMQWAAIGGLAFMGWSAISARKVYTTLCTTEKDLKKERNQFNLVLKGASAGLWTWDIATDAMTWSPQMRILLGIGCKQKTFAWEDFISRLHPEDAEWVTTHIHQHLYQRASFDVECRLQHQSGNYVWIQCFGQAQWDDEGLPVAMTGVIINIQKRKSDEAQIKQLTQYTQNILRALDASAIVVITDPKGVITHVNEQFCEVSGYERHEILGKTHALVNSGTHGPEVFHDLWTTITQGNIWNGELCNRNKNGDLYWVETTIVPFMDDHGEPYQFVAIRFEVTQRKQVENQLREAKLSAEQTSEIKGQFLSSVSHELRTPLNGVIGAGHLLQQSGLNNEQLATCAMLQSSARTLQRLINDVLDFEELTNGNVQAGRTRFLPGLVVGEWIEGHQHKAQGKNLDLRAVLHDDLPLMLEGDERRYKQIVDHLIDNAIKFTSQGNIVVKLNIINRYTVQPAVDPNTGAFLTHQVATPMATLRLEVEDTGIGMAKYQVERLFQQFTQADSSYTREYEGLGLGLAIVKQLVELLDGDVSVTSRLGEGSRFTVDIPFTLVTDQTIHDGIDNNQAEGLLEHAKKLPSGKFQLDNPLQDDIHILYVEDNRVNQEVTRRMLEKVGMSVTLAENGEVGLATLENLDKPVDLVLMDCQMPVMDGYEATRRLRELEQLPPEGWCHINPIPVVALTANAHTEGKAQCEVAGMDAYLAKPVSPKALLQIIERTLPQKLCKFPKSFIKPVQQTAPSQTP